jgi:hypothetical protein
MKRSNNQPMDNELLQSIEDAIIIKSVIMSKFLQESLFITLLLITLISTNSFSFSKGLARHERQFIDMSSLDTQKDLYVEAAGFFLKDKNLKFSPTSGKNEYQLSAYQYNHYCCYYY